MQEEMNKIEQPLGTPEILGDSAEIAVNGGEAYLIFSILGERWAFKTSFVQEIIHAAKIHPLPFVPDYIEGVVNCHGIPYTVVNTQKMAGKADAEITGGTVLVFKRDDDECAIKISNIEVFFEPEKTDIKSDGIVFKKELIPFFDMEEIEARLLEDLTEDE